MKFGTSAAARVDSPKVVALPTSVRVGREPSADVRVGAMPSSDPNAAMGYELSTGNARGRLRPLGSTRQTLQPNGTPGDTADFEFLPCEDCYVQNFVLPESIARDLSVLQIKNCRISYFDGAGEVPGEFFSNQGGTAIGRIFFGSEAKARVPIVVTMVNTGTAILHNVNGTFLVTTAVDCGGQMPLPIG